MTRNEFSGAKLGLLVGGQVLTLLRDDRPGIPYPGLWDLPGGAAEPGETPEDCALRETLEETGLVVPPAWLVWRKYYRAAPPDVEFANWFFIAEGARGLLPKPRLGAEGQALRWIGIEDYLALPDAIPHQQARLAEYLLIRARAAGLRDP